MRIICITLMVVLSVSGCSLMKTTLSKNESIDQENNQTIVKSDAKNEVTQDAERFFLKQDSTASDYQIQFYPRGEFKVAMDGAMTGVFDSIRLTGKQKQLSSSSAQSKVHERKLSEIKGGSTTIDTTRTENKNSKKLNFPILKVAGYVLILTGFIYLLYIICKKYLSKRLPFSQK